MRKPWKGLHPAAALAASLLSAAAWAEGDDSITYGVTPWVGYRFGGHLEDSASGESVRLEARTSFALALTARTEPGREYEVFYSRQSTRFEGSRPGPIDAVVEYLHIGGTLDLTDATPPFRPYLAGGLGLTRLAPDGPPGREDDRFSLSLALGMRLPLTPHLLARLEGRGFVTFLDTGTSLFCRSDQGGALCQLRAQGSTLVQGQVLAGVTLEF